ncbi:hypothetical protein EV193_11341 [Herbihabitans rhizosphaerae]|uniref:Uncharacterized protein n=1 Tax=Herbihabitans rhizosphaerae TaxID=1872711 RepID=A0A4Q7KE54_9PSEU|nr:hypothetical protein [Herbihabitans rhizosphaerae]RZS32200.1 hypothetical protein EV193_11341 [Herbihabitans rhizosphaerae]
MDTKQALDYWALEGGEKAPVAAEVTDTAPQVFAVCEIERELEEGEVADTRVLAWGLVLPNRVEVVSVDPGMRGTFKSVHSAMELFSRLAEVGIVRP